MPSGRTILQVKDLGVTFLDGTAVLDALHGISFSLAVQEFVCLLGPSGSGKSTLLRGLAGLVPPTCGEIHFSLNGDGREKPRVGLVFQQANLMPWRSVLDNIALPLELLGIPKEDARQQAMQQVRRVGLEGFEHEWPRNLSGGMAQRVALGRALVQSPDLLLLDEPFGSLDALTREHMGSELLNLWQDRRITVLMVTHSISEAAYLADRVLVFTPRPGNISLDMVVDLPRPRTEETRYLPRFNELTRQLRSAIG